MPRRETPFLPNQYYHLYNRGNNRQAVFFEAENYLYFLRGLRRYLLPVASIIAYCLMPSHYHLLVRVRSTVETSEISGAMQKLLISYTKAINKRFGRLGGLFQGAFQSKPVAEYEHLLSLCLYIHANPVKDGLVSRPEDWLYSNYLEWLGLRAGRLVKGEFVQEHFGSPADYRVRMDDYLQTRCAPEDLKTYLQALE